MALPPKIDWDIIAARTTHLWSARSLPTKSIAFLTIVIDQIFPGLEEKMGEIITDGPDDRGIDAVHFIESHDSCEVFLFQSKYRETYASSSKTINDDEVLKVSLFINQIFEKSESLVSCNNFRLKEAIQRIWSLHENGKICRYRVIFCSNGGGFSTTAENIVKTICENNPSVQFEYYGPKETVYAMSSEGRKAENGRLQVIGKEILERSDGDVRGIIASIDARSFIDLITLPGTDNVKRNVFDDNLRIYLGSRGGHNPSIIEAATSPDNYLFWYLNNGITITCRNFSYNKGHVNPVINFEDFQIVNGAQTSHSLVEAFRDRPNSIENVVLMVRIYATERSDIAEKVAVATNSQARIQSRDLKSNDKILKRLELAFCEQGYFFERKKNLYADRPSEKRIDALKLGQIILSYELGEPDKARTESDSIFDLKFSQIFHEKLDVDRLIRLFELYRIIENLRDKYQYENPYSIESGHEHLYLIYGHWFILFACKLLLVKSGNSEIPVGADAESLVAEAIHRVALACSQNKAVAHYQMFRSPKTKDKLLSEISAKQLDFLEIFANS
jgi:hypothetical protein